MQLAQLQSPSFLGCKTWRPNGLLCHMCGRCFCVASFLWALQPQRLLPQCSRSSFSLALHTCIDLSTAWPLHIFEIWEHQCWVCWCHEQVMSKIEGEKWRWRAQMGCCKRQYTHTPSWWQACWQLPISLACNIGCLETSRHPSFPHSASLGTIDGDWPVRMYSWPGTLGWSSPSSLVLWSSCSGAWQWD